LNDTQLFAFESDFVDSLRCIPMAIRFKLDACGVKLSLRQWSRFTHEDRHSLLLQPCATPAEHGAYRATLVELIALRSGESAKALAEPPPDAWQDAVRTAPVVRGYALGVGVAPPSDGQWASLTPLQRFVLVKLTRDNHDNVNFLPAMVEFGLLLLEARLPADCGVVPAGSARGGEGRLELSAIDAPTLVFGASHNSESPTACPTRSRLVKKPPEIWFVLDGPLNISPSHWKGWAAIGLLALVLAPVILAADWASKRLPSTVNTQVATVILVAMFIAFGGFRLWTGKHTFRGLTRRTRCARPSRPIRRARVGSG
jgi:hypothetical protein